MSCYSTHAHLLFVCVCVWGGKGLFVFADLHCSDLQMLISTIAVVFTTMLLICSLYFDDVFHFYKSDNRIGVSCDEC